MTGLLADAKSGASRFYLQFGGQGAPWYKELSRLYAEPNLKKFFDVALSAIDAERTRVEGSIGLPHGIDARAWLDDESKIPSEEYLGCAAVSIPMIQMVQFAHVENLNKNGFPLSDLIQYSYGATGHSQGLIPACLLGMDKKGDEYYDGVGQFMKYLLYLGVSAQKAFPYFEATADEISESEKLGAGIPAPMVAVLGQTHDYIQKLVDQTNQVLPADKKIYISLYNNSSNRILSSFRSSLVAFHKQHKALVEKKEFKFVYLRTSCPFHSVLMEPVREIFEQEIKYINFVYNGSDIKIPVISFADGQDMRDSGKDLPIKMYVDMAIKPLYWDKSVKPGVDESSVTHFIDFGPGKTSMRLSQDVMKDLDASKDILGAAVPKDLKTILGE